MRHPRCVRWLRGDDRAVGICLWCAPTVDEARRVATGYEDRGYTVTMGVCPACVAVNHADSIIRSHWLLLGCEVIHTATPQQEVMAL